MNKKPTRMLQVPPEPTFSSAALFLLRAVVGLAFMFHGWGKIQQPWSWMGPEAPVPGVFQFLAAVSEFGGGLFWILGLLTPVASLGIAATMSVAIYMHLVIRGDPFVSTKGGGSYELAAVFFSIAMVLLLLGPGRFSLDRLVFGERIGPEKR